MARRRRKRFGWEDLHDQDLLDLRLCDLGVSHEGTWLEEPIERVQHELDARGLRVRPHYWVSDEWFSPERVPGIALPFFLTHPRLMRLERKQMLEVEGGTHASCLRLLRHEVGHVVMHSFALERRRSWQRTFGKSSEAYPEYYRPNPKSRRYVIHLPYWYAQAHPDEDFAETFAVWLPPRSSWRRRYADWPALRKLEYVDELMEDLAGRPPRSRSRRKVDPVSQIKTTLREYYIHKRDRYASFTTHVWDDDLRRLFSGPHTKGGESASAFLRRNRRELRQMVTRATDRHELAVDTVLSEMIARSHELLLRAVGPKRQLVTDLAILLAARGVEYVYRGRDWHAL